jgi:phosphatidylinositol alpha-1,6-mannosyltransferase
MIQQELFSVLSANGGKACLTTLLFHKIPRTADPLTPNELCLASFRRMLEFVRDSFNVLPLIDATRALREAKLPRRALAISFDDGYADWLDTAAPVLLDLKLPATFFITTEQLAGPALWHERIIAAVRALPDQGAALPYGFEGFVQLHSVQARAALAQDLQERLKYVPLPERLRAIEMLEAQATSPLQLPPRFDAGSVRELHRMGFQIGAHTIRHPILTECSLADAKAEIGGSREELEGIIGERVHLFAYPNGRPNRDYLDEHVSLVKACGYEAAVATCNGTADSVTDPFQLPRFVPWSAHRGRLAYQLARNYVSPDGVWRATAPAAASRSEKVNCLLVASTFPPIRGGSAVVYENLCSYMPRGSMRVLTASRNHLGNSEVAGWRDQDRRAAFPVDRIDLLRPLMMPPPSSMLESLYRFVFLDLPLFGRIFFHAARIVRRHRVNVVCIGELVTLGWLGPILRKLFKCRLIIYVHGEEITTTTSGRLYGKSRKRYLAAADKVVAVSSFTCNALSREMGLRPDRVFLIENGVDTRRFFPGERDAGIIARHGLEGKKILLTVGRLVPRKGMDMAIRAMPLVLKERPDVHYLMVGDGEYRPYLERLVTELGLEQHVTFAGAVGEDELVRYYRSCDIFAMPNRTMPDGDTEGFGLVFLEANACGKPVIGGLAGGAVEAVKDGQTGFLVDGNEPSAIARAVLALVESPETAARMGAAGLQFARERDAQTIADHFFTLCQRMLRSPGAY